LEIVFLLNWVPICKEKYTFQLDFGLDFWNPAKSDPWNHDSTHFLF
jgi:hypothetical protein